MRLHRNRGIFLNGYFGKGISFENIRITITQFLKFVTLLIAAGAKMGHGNNIVWRDILFTDIAEPFFLAKVRTDRHGTSPC